MSESPIPTRAVQDVAARCDVRASAVMRMALSAVIAALMLPAATRAQCPEPSALDRAPGATPLRVERGSGGALILSWEPTGADRYLVHEGSLPTAAGRLGFDHVVRLGVREPSVTLPAPTRNAYYLVSAQCPDGISGVGRDSSGVERPHGGVTVVRLALSGGSGVFAAQASLEHRATDLYLDQSGVLWLGPFAASALGAPLVAENLMVSGRLRAIATFMEPFPDPSFDPSAMAAIDVLQIGFTFQEVPPDCAEFVVTDCRASDILGARIGDVTCIVSGCQTWF